MKILLQAGHAGRTTGATGSPNEMSFNIDISNKVSDELRLRGFDTKVINADPTDEEIKGDWDLFLAIHYDADIYGSGGGFVDFPEPSTDGATEKSQRIAYLIRQEYFGTTKIVNKPERSNNNTRYYYMWKRMSYNTPCVIIECGVGMHVPDDHQVLHFERPKVVEGIVKGICLAFNVNYNLPKPPVVDPKPPEPPEGEDTTVPGEDLPEKPCESDKILNEVRDVLWGKGWWWVKYRNIKKLLPK